ncbi:MAG: DsbA family protein [Gaiellales bacterium]
MPPTPRKPVAAPGQGSARNRTFILAGIAALVIAALAIGAVVLSGGSSKDSNGKASEFLDGIPQSGAVLGSAGAKVELLQFEDPQCPICKEYQDNGWSQIVEEYVKPGKVKVRFAGLAFIGPDSEKALRFILAAGQQDKLFQYAEELYSRQGPENGGWVTDGLLEDVSNDLGLDHAKLAKDADSSEIAKQATQMSAEAQKLEVQGTPSFFITIGDAKPYLVSVPRPFPVEEFRPIFDDALGG